MAREPEFLKGLFQKNIEVWSGKYLPTFTFPIGNTKETGEMEFRTFSLTLEYQHNDSNRFWLSSLASYLTVSGEFVASRAIAGRIEGSLYCQSKGYYNRIIFTNAIMLEK